MVLIFSLRTLPIILILSIFDVCLFVCGCSEPLCTIGLGVCGLFSTLDTNTHSWPFTNYSLTGVRQANEGGS